MPYYTGLEVYKRLRELYPEVPFILCTAKTIEELPPLPADMRVIHKPVTANEVCDLVAEILGV